MEDENVTNVTKKPRLTKRMKEFLAVFEAQACRITISCEKANQSRQTYYRWMQNLKFAEEVERINEKFKDFVEGKIITHIKSPFPKISADMCKFYAKTKMKGRGYIEKQEIDMGGSLATLQLSKEERVEEIKRLLGK